VHLKGASPAWRRSRAWHHKLMDRGLPGQVPPFRGQDGPPPAAVAWWKQQLERQQEELGQNATRRRGTPRYGSGSDDDDDLDVSDHRWRRASEVDALRDELRAARRKLDAGQRRERALRRALQHADAQPPLAPSAFEPDISDSRRPLSRPGPPRMPIGTGGLLDQALMESGMLNTEEGRREVAEFLARATAISGVPTPTARQPLPPPPAMQQHAHPPGPAAAIAIGQPEVELQEDNEHAARYGAPAAMRALAFGQDGRGAAVQAAQASQRSAAAQSSSEPQLPCAPPQQQPPPSPPPSAGSSTVPPSEVEGEARKYRVSFADRDLELTAEAMLEELIASEIKVVVRQCVREMVAPMLPSSSKRGAEAAQDGGVYGQIFSTVLTGVVTTETADVVGEVVRQLAEDLVVRRGAERVFEAMVENILADELMPVASEARIAVVADGLLQDAMAPIAREVAVAALFEARGASARVREAEERQQVAERAASGLFERLCLQRLLQHVATNGEVLLLQRQAAELLDELVGEWLARRALAVGREHQQLQSSAVFSAAHTRIAYGALVDEMLAQLRMLAASGLEAGVPPVALETDTEGEDD
jgi:hypothetical protein